MTNEVTQVMPTHYWGIGSEWFWSFCQFVAIALTLIFIVKQVFSIAKQVKLQTKQTETEAMSHVVQAVCRIQERWDSEIMQRVRCDVCSRWKEGKREFDGACEHIANYFEELGTFVKINAIPEDVVWDVQSWNIEYYWCIFEKGIAKAREDYKEPVYCEFEGLFGKMRKKSDEKEVPPVDEPSIDEFLEREIRATKACLRG
ncbi:MAG: hypothetical protein ACLP9S_05785 [Syntrophales bacterium]